MKKIILNLANLLPLKLSLLVITGLLVSSCASSGKKSNSSGALNAPGNFSLTQTEAAERADAISDLHYDLHLALSADQPRFDGDVTIQFQLLHILSELSLDFQEGQVVSANVNGQVVSLEQKNGQVALPMKYLKLGANNLSLHFTHAYSNNGMGLYRFKDPEDGKTYLYTQFENFEANRMLPCFDQPDLKAQFKLSVDAPKDWVIVSAMRESKIDTSASGQAWIFPETPKMSPYVFSLHAGPYKVWTSKAGQIPLRLMARQSWAKYVNAAEWFTITQQGLQFYGQYFHYPYPFLKYDQVIVPDFNAGAMENIAAVTFTEHYMSRGTPTEEERQHLQDTILHEMAHMWFGDLVTMKWWNGIWLNESFASYMSHLSSSKATRFAPKAWIDFFSDMKSWAYTEDQWVTTHPIEQDVPDTNAAETIFDGISYGKGASVLKQLSFYIGADHFRDGVRDYFKTYNYSNTQLKDFIGALEKSSNLKLDNWADLWLRHAGVDTIRTVWSCQAGKISRFAIEQTPPAGETQYRPHRTQLALYQKIGSSLVTRKAIAVSYAAASTPVPELIGRHCPAFVFPNEDDQDYVKISLDETSLQTAKTELRRLENPLTRMMVWNALYNMVRDAKLPVQDYAELVLQNLPFEKDELLASEVFATVTAHHGLPIFYYYPQASEAEKQARLEAVKKMEAMIWGQLQDLKPGSDMQKLWWDHFVALAETPAALGQLEKILNAQSKIKGLDLDQDRRWSVIHRLSEMNGAEAFTLLQAEKQKDTTELGIKSAQAAEAVQPVLSVKQKFFADVLDQKNGMPFARRRSIVGSLLPSSQPQMALQMENEIYRNLRDLSQKADEEFVSTYVHHLLPARCEPQSRDRMMRFLNDEKADLAPMVIRELRIIAQEDDRCIQIRARAQGLSKK